MFAQGWHRFMVCVNTMRLHWRNWDLSVDGSLTRGSTSVLVVTILFQLVGAGTLNPRTTGLDFYQAGMSPINAGLRQNLPLACIVASILLQCELCSSLTKSIGRQVAGQEPMPSC